MYYNKYLKYKRKYLLKQFGSSAKRSFDDMDSIDCESHQNIVMIVFGNYSHQPYQPYCMTYEKFLEQSNKETNIFRFDEKKIDYQVKSIIPSHKYSINIINYERLQEMIEQFNKESDQRLIVYLLKLQFNNVDNHIGSYNFNSNNQSSHLYLIIKWEITDTLPTISDLDILNNFIVKSDYTNNKLEIKFDSYDITINYLETITTKYITYITCIMIKHMGQEIEHLVYKNNIKG